MFCPNCGKDNSNDLRFCATCGTNLEAVAQALSGREDDFFTKMDGGIDQLIGRYAEHVFRDAPQHAAERRVVRSWQLLGQALLTSLLDILLFVLMWNLLPLRFLILVISTPFRVLGERSSSKQSKQLNDAAAYQPPTLTPVSRLWLADGVPSVTDSTTTNLSEPSPATSTQAAPTTERLK
jgi:hypothetical protein